MLPPPPRSTLFPYTTLFRSRIQVHHLGALDGEAALPQHVHLHRHVGNVLRLRSEEHTSELQSHSDLVCRLLLEKKNYTSKAATRLHSAIRPRARPSQRSRLQ